ncbi:MAG TPA: VOC family protein [Thermoanaerobaculia bacterium]|jgi:PhnB protein|nr:VOC family protein [Thermoanaerobaculia bacterium]
MTAQVIPYLHIKGAARAIEFYRQAFGATEVLRLSEPDGKIGHAEIQIGGARIMIADEYPEYGILGPQSLGGTSVSLHLTVPDVDAFAQQAVAAGAKLAKPIKDEFYGERGGRLEDPFGHVWQVMTRIEEVSPEEMQRRYDALLAGGGQG